MSKIAVIGAGAFGTALAISLARQGHDINLIARGQAHVDAMRSHRENRARLAGVLFPSRLNVSLTLPYLPEVALIAVPTQAVADYIGALADSLAGATLVACNKGIDLRTGLGPTGILSNILPDARLAVLSGPGFAVDIAAQLPTAMTLACYDAEACVALQRQLSTDSLRLYRSGDVAGVELGGALKNVIAIAAGIAIGAGLGESARAALITRGFAELGRFATARGALPETLTGLSGFGDLVLTCTSEKSRNMRFGMALGRGAQPTKDETVEGASTAKIVSKLAKADKISTPITDLIAAIVAGKSTVAQARDLLLARPLKEE